MKRIFSSPVKTLAVLSLLLTSLVFLVTSFWQRVSSFVLPNTTLGLYNRESWESVLVELHGIAFELSVIGVLLIWLDSRRYKNGEISRLKEDLDDYATLDFPEINVKKLGHLKRLNEHGIKNIDVQNLVLNGLSLKGIEVESCKLISLKVTSGSITSSLFRDVKMRSSNFEGSTIKNTSFEKCDLLKSEFCSATCKGVSFSRSCLERADFTNADLQNGLFIQCNIREAKFEGANLKHANFNNAMFVDITELAKASNLDYVKISTDLLDELVQLRPDMKYKKIKGRP